MAAKRISGHRGWGTHPRYRNGVAETVFVSPDGQEYRRVTRGKVDLIVAMKTDGLPPLKLRRLNNKGA